MGVHRVPNYRALRSRLFEGRYVPGQRVAVDGKKSDADGWQGEGVIKDNTRGEFLDNDDFVVAGGTTAWVRTFAVGEGLINDSVPIGVSASFADVRVLLASGHVVANQLLWVEGETALADGGQGLGQIVARGSLVDDNYGTLVGGSWAWRRQSQNPLNSITIGENSKPPVTVYNYESLIAALTAGNLSAGQWVMVQRSDTTTRYGSGLFQVVTKSNETTDHHSVFVGGSLAAIRNNGAPWVPYTKAWDFTNGLPSWIGHSRATVGALIQQFDGSFVQPIPREFGLEGGRRVENLFIASEKFSDVAWLKFFLSYDDETGAIIPTSSGGQKYISQYKDLVAGKRYAATFYVSAAEYANFQITPSTGFTGTGSRYQNFDLENGVLGSGSLDAAYQSAGMEHLGEGVYRCWMTDVASTTTNGRFVGAVVNTSADGRLPSIAGNDSDGLILHRAQFQVLRPGQTEPDPEYVSRGTEILGDEALVNGDFSDGENSWDDTPGIWANGSGTVAGGEYTVAVSSYEGVGQLMTGLKPGTTYRLGWAKATADGTAVNGRIYVAPGSSSSPGSGPVLNYNVTSAPGATTFVATQHTMWIGLSSQSGSGTVVWDGLTCKPIVHHGWGVDGVCWFNTDEYGIPNQQGTRTKGLTPQADGWNVSAGMTKTLLADNFVRCSNPDSLTGQLGVSFAPFLIGHTPTRIGVRVLLRAGPGSDRISCAIYNGAFLNCMYRVLSGPGRFSGGLTEGTGAGKGVSGLSETEPTLVEMFMLPGLSNGASTLFPVFYVDTRSGGANPSALVANDIKIVVVEELSASADSVSPYEALSTVDYGFGVNGLRWDDGPWRSKYPVRAAGIVRRPAVTNLLLRSEEVDTTPWAVSAAGAGTNAVVTQLPDEDGVSVWRVQTDCGDTSSVANRSILRNNIAGVTVSQTYTTSIEIRAHSVADVGDEVRMVVESGGATEIAHVLTADWQRVSFTGAATATTLGLVLETRGTVTDNQTADFDVRMPQCTQTAVANAYVPTTTTAATADADVITVNKSLAGIENYGNWFIQHKPQHATSVEQNNQPVIAIRGSAGNSADLYNQFGNFGLYVAAGGNVQWTANIAAANWVPGQTQSVAYRLMDNKGSVVTDGVERLTDTDMVVPVITDIYLGGLSGSKYSGIFASIIYTDKFVPTSQNIVMTNGDVPLISEEE